LKAVSTLPLLSSKPEVWSGGPRLIGSALTR
jgi:hypothetical protein